MLRLAALIASCALPVHATCAADAMLVLDGSASMAEIGFDVAGPTRIAEAREAIAGVMPEVERVRRIGLLTYGPGGAGACDGIALRLAPTPRAADALIAEADALRPSGLTPLADAVGAAAEALLFRTRPAIVVLVTDGNETCGGTPCALADRLAAEAQNLTVHVIGFRAAPDLFAWNNPEQVSVTGDTAARCLADRTGGLFVGTETVAELEAALLETLGCPLIGQDRRAITKRIGGRFG